MFSVGPPSGLLRYTASRPSYRRRSPRNSRQYNMPKTNPYDARLIYSASESDANMLWATRFFAPDPFIFIQKRGKRYLVMNDLEIDRAKSEAHVDKVLPYSEYVKRKQKEGIAFPTVANVLSEVFRDLKIRAVEVPGTFPVGLADQLRSMKFKLQPAADPFWPDREFKTSDEVRFITRFASRCRNGHRSGN